MCSVPLSSSLGLQPHRGYEEEGLDGPNHQFLDVGWIPPSWNTCKGNDGETSPDLWATNGGWQHSWKETAGLGWGVGFAPAQGLAPAFADVSAQSPLPLPRCVSEFSGFFPPNPLFHHFTIFSLRDDVKIISMLRGTSLTFARFMDTCMAGTIYPKALVGSGPSWTLRNLHSRVTVSLERLNSKIGISPGQRQAQLIHCLLASAQTLTCARCALAQSMRRPRRDLCS